MYDITNLETYLNARTWIKLVKSKSGSNVVFSLVGNKLDLADKDGKREVQRSQAESFCLENNIAFSETTAINKTSTLVIERLVKKVVFIHRDKKEPPTLAISHDLGDPDVGAILEKLKQIEREERTSDDREKDLIYSVN